MASIARAEGTREAVRAGFPACIRPAFTIDLSRMSGPSGRLPAGRPDDLPIRRDWDAIHGGVFSFLAMETNAATLARPLS
jgi:hypothetical protein